MQLDASSALTFDFIHSFENEVSGNVLAAFSSVAGGNPSPSPGTATISMEQIFLKYSTANGSKQVFASI